MGTAVLGCLCGVEIEFEGITIFEGTATLGKCLVTR